MFDRTHYTLDRIDPELFAVIEQRRLGRREEAQQMASRWASSLGPTELP